jgi:hypothetical protein
MRNIVTEMYDVQDDNFNRQTLKRSRKIKLTLRHLNKLRKKRELDKLETELRKDRLSKIYGSSDQGDESPMF